MVTSLLLITIGYAISLAIVIGFGMFVLMQGWKNPTYQVFFLVCLSIVAYQVDFICGINTSDPAIAYIIWYLNIFASVAIGITVLHFFIRATGSIPRFGLILKTMYVISALILISTILYPHAFLNGVVFHKLYFNSYADESALFYYVPDAFVLLSFSLAYLVLFLERKRAGDEGKKRIDYYLFGLTYGVITGLTAFAPDFNLPIDPVWSVFIGTFVIPFAYGMVKKDLMDIGIAIKSTVIYTIIIAGLTGLLTVVSLLSDWMFHLIPGFGYWTVPLITALVSVVAGELYSRKAAEAEQLKYEFITIVTHKFRTPLTRIRWQSEALIAQPSLVPEAKAGIKQITESSVELIQLSNLLIDAVRSEKGNYLYTWRNISLDQLTKKIFASFATALAAKHISATVTIDPNLPLIRADEERLGSVIHVLIENAISYTPEQGHIWIALTAAKKDTVRFSITDTGIGMNKSEISHLFSRFYRGARAQRADTEGVGLGLSMAKTVIERHRGSIGADSDGAGMGSTFWFTLPVIH